MLSGKKEVPNFNLYIYMLPKVTVFFTVLVVMTKYLTGSNLRKNGFILAYSSRRNILPQQE